MGTFHDDRDPLHGITVAARTADTVYVGRCHERDAARILLLDVDEHREGQDGRSIDEYLERAARFGVWKRHDRLSLPAAAVASLTPLSEYFHRGAEAAPPPVAAAESTPDAGTFITLTDGAREEVRRLLAAEARPGLGLRLGVAGGGCSGLTYRVEFDTPRADDLVLGQDGFDVLLDPKSTIYLRGVTLDHQRGLAGRGFQFRNPNASNTCGCGESFAV